MSGYLEEAGGLSCRLENSVTNKVDGKAPSGALWRLIVVNGCGAAAA
jgi:hypothetical protein